MEPTSTTRQRRVCRSISTHTPSRLGHSRPADRRPISSSWKPPGPPMITAVRSADFDELAFFRSIQASGARALLIGRRALVLLGLPVLTADYDYWLAIDDIDRFNAGLTAFGLHPTRTPEDARRHRRYALESDERVDVLVGRSVPTVDGDLVEFIQLWERRQ